MDAIREAPEKREAASDVDMGEGDGEQTECYGAATTVENQENADLEETNDDRAALLSDSPRRTVVGSALFMFFFQVFFQVF
jgi:hypothetical protein